MWLIQEGPSSRKHKGKEHPIATFVVHYLITILFTMLPIASTDHYNPMLKSRQKTIACFLASYFCVCFMVRIALKWKWRTAKYSYKLYSEFYQLTFLCSVTIINVAVGFYYDRPIVSQAYLLSVGIDQFLWYIDLIGYFIWGNFPVGVCKYLFRNNWFHRITSCHHLWTIPLVFWGCGNEIQFLALPLSACVIILNVLLSRCMTPISIEKSLKDDDDKCTSIYLNINLSHEMWSDVTFFNPTPNVPYLVRLIFWWYSTNVLVFLALYALSRQLHCV